MTAVAPPCLSHSQSALQDGTVDPEATGQLIMLHTIYKHIDNPTIYELKQGWRIQRVNHKLCKQLCLQEQCIVVSIKPSCKCCFVAYVNPNGLC